LGGNDFNGDFESFLFAKARTGRNDSS